MRLGIIGAADITAKAVIEPAQVIAEVQIAGIAARDPARAESLARQAGIERVYRSYSDLIADSSLDAVYIPLANSLHAPWTLAALAAGRHVLCEKPLASNAAQARAMVEAGDRCQRLMVEAFHWRYHPVAARMIELSRQIGPLQRVEAHFNIHIPRDDIRFQLELAGGAFMDLGCYCVHMMRTVAGSEPEVLRANAVEGPRGIDASMEAELSFPGGLRGFVNCSMVAEKTVWPESMIFRAWGRAGKLEILNPMAPQFGHQISANLADGTSVNEVLDARTSYEYQLRAFCRAVAGEESPLTGGADVIANMAVIDAVYEASGLGIRH
ncbi:MAG TPA: Gfo/Idh/MocA family oxidoreductase [Acidimicrobiales bacterium]|nr:Gfo/Idh/MocA family oxidoreductase [Acidimicrobiales bacterium]